MKHLYPWLLALLLGLAGPAQGFNYHPFRPFWLYQLSETNTPGDTTHTLLMDFAFVRQHPDSTYRLNGRVVAIPQRASVGCFATQVQRPDGLFGAFVVVRNPATMRAEYLLRAANGRTFTLRPRAALNQPWVATASGITARVTARSFVPVFGQLDSVVTITLSDGQVLRIGKHHGWLEGPALGAYLTGQRPRTLTTTAIQGERMALGMPAVGSLAIHDYQPGDVFLRYSRQQASGSSSICSESWTRDSVLTRAVSRTGDSIIYTLRQRILTRNYGQPTAPFPFCNNVPGVTLSPASTVTLVVGRFDDAEVGVFTHAVSGLRPLVRLTTAGVRTASYNGRKTQAVIRRQACVSSTPADSIMLGPMVDIGLTNQYAAGLGLVGSRGFAMDSNLETSLLGYRKVNLPTSTGVEQWGTVRTFASILKASEYKPAATTAAFPNPFARELTVRLETQRAQPVTVRLYNALGQEVFSTIRAIGTGAQQLPLALPRLMPGLYTLHLRHDGRMEVLRVMRAE